MSTKVQELIFLEETVLILFYPMHVYTTTHQKSMEHTHRMQLP